MSYILDALRKSEQKRQQGSVPDLLTVQDWNPLKAGKRTWWPYVLIGILLLSVGAGSSWLYNIIYSGKANIERIQITAPPQENPLRQVAPLTSSQFATPKKVPSQKKLAGKVQKSAHKADNAHTDAQVSAPRASLAEGPPPSKQITFKEQELPLAIQQELPRPVISAHIYDANAAARIISVHGNVMHEGEFVAAGLRLESITPDGVILSYKKYRFYRPLF